MPQHRQQAFEERKIEEDVNRQRCHMRSYAISLAPSIQAFLTRLRRKGFANVYDWASLGYWSIDTTLQYTPALLLDPPCPFSGRASSLQSRVAPIKRIKLRKDAFRTSCTLARVQTGGWRMIVLLDEIWVKDQHRKRSTGRRILLARWSRCKVFENGSVEEADGY